MLIIYASGFAQEAILISLRGAQLRVAPKDGDDLLEFNLVNGVWLSEHGEPVTFDLTLGVLESIGFKPGTHQVRPPSWTSAYVN